MHEWTNEWFHGIVKPVIQCYHRLQRHTQRERRIQNEKCTIIRYFTLHPIHNKQIIHKMRIKRAPVGLKWHTCFLCVRPYPYMHSVLCTYTGNWAKREKHEPTNKRRMKNELKVKNGRKRCLMSYYENVSVINFTVNNTHTNTHTHVKLWMENDDTSKWMVHNGNGMCNGKIEINVWQR